MSKFVTAPLLAAAIFSLGGCLGGGGSSGGAPQVQAPNAISQSSGNTVSTARADVSRASDGRILLRMTEGPMSGMSMTCTDATLGRCIVVGGPDGTSSEGTLLARYNGDYAFVGNFNVLQVTEDGIIGQSQLVHAARPGSETGNVQLPQGNVDYTGAFSAGAGLQDGPSGMVEGTVQMVADFNQAVLSIQMDGSFESGEHLSASFANITIDTASGSFTATDDSVILFQGAVVDGGILDGAFYGPNAEEAAGVFSVGNDLGGMSGIFLACQGMRADCVQP